MNRRELLQRSAAVGAVAVLASSTRTALGSDESAPTGPSSPLTPPGAASIPVAFVMAKDAVVIDFAGPWEVFQDVSIQGRKEPAFSLYTVAETMDPITASGGMTIVPNYSIDTAPAPKIIVITAQKEPSKRLSDWIRHASTSTDVTMSICTGAFVLAATGLLSGRAATTHHNAFRELAMDNPDITVRRGVRFVDDGKFSSSGGLSSGIDLALHTVERYFGREQGQAWVAQMGKMVSSMVRVTITPEWVGVLDFQTRFPSALPL